jgi:DNA repair exonuclease SbcCD ATPase subunit
MLKNLFVILFFFNLFYWGALFPESRAEKQKQIEEIDSNIAELKKVKIGLEGRATRLENMGQQLQFDQGLLQDAKRHFEAAAKMRENAAIIQQKIDALEMKKAALLKSIKPVFSELPDKASSPKAKGSSY